MFISQVIFEMKTDDEEMLISIMKKKKESLTTAEGITSFECWKQLNSTGSAYCLVSKWDNQDSFKKWLANDHKGKSHSKRQNVSKLQIKKTVYQFELAE